MIPLSPLQLRQHFFSLVSIRANPAGTATGELSLEPKIRFQRASAPPNHWALALRVIIKSLKPEMPFCYEADIEIHGIVEVHESYPPEKQEQLAAVNGLSLLYSAVREMFVNVTARSAHGLVSLPTVNFIELVAQKRS